MSMNGVTIFEFDALIARRVDSPELGDLHPVLSIRIQNRPFFASNSDPLFMLIRSGDKRSYDDAQRIAA